MNKKATIRRLTDALRQIRSSGYTSKLSKTRQTVLAHIAIAEDALYATEPARRHVGGPWKVGGR